MQPLLLQLIRAYQRHVSPHKGYGCAHRLHRQRASGCSGVGLHAIRRHGAWRGLLMLRQRLQRCARSAQWLREQRRRNEGGMWVPQAQRGECDPGCDLGDLPCDCGCGERLERRIRDFFARKHARWLARRGIYSWLHANRHLLAVLLILAFFAFGACQIWRS